MTGHKLAAFEVKELVAMGEGDTTSSLFYKKKKKAALLRFQVWNPTDPSWNLLLWVIFG